MGYQSYYSLTVLGTDNESEKLAVIKQLRKENDDAATSFDDNGDSTGLTKWHESDDDMKEFSKKHPHLIFRIHREGEDNPDLSYTYYKDGKMQVAYATITYDEYDESLLV